ncbi:MAG: DUF3486 family protein [Hydrogenophilales bacterium]|nr:DUF3486 family protein [Hydrogenophilales bacterium]
MPKRKAVEGLPNEVKAWLDGALVEGNFSGYERLAAELKARGFEIGKSAVHRYGQEFEERLKALRIVTEQARAVVEHSPDEEDAVTQALVRLTQEKLFTVLMDMQVDPEKVNLSGITRSIAELARSSVTVKKWAAEARAKIAAKMTELEGQAKAGKGRLDPETLRIVREEIYGLV